MSGIMRKRRPKPRAPIRRFIVGTPRNMEGDDPLFDERELEYYGGGDEKMKPPDE